MTTDGVMMNGSVPTAVPMAMATPHHPRRHSSLPQQAMNKEQCPRILAMLRGKTTEQCKHIVTVLTDGLNSRWIQPPELCLQSAPPQPSHTLPDQRPGMPICCQLSFVWLRSWTTPAWRWWRWRCVVVWKSLMTEHASEAFFLIVGQCFVLLLGVA